MPFDFLRLSNLLTLYLGLKLSFHRAARMSNNAPIPGQASAPTGFLAK